MRLYPLALVIFLSALVFITPYETVALDTDGTPNGTEKSIDSGFRPDVNGFGFQNYGSDLSVVDLTAVEMQRMFGDQVCASTADGNCVLTLPAKRWMNQAIQAMSYGHCEGIAVLSDLIYYYQKNPDDFGGPRAIDLSLDNELLQREIGYWWVTQVTTPGGSNRVSDSPNEVLDTLIETFENGSEAGEWWVMGIYQPDGSGGHSITPYAVEDAGNGTHRIFVYDNNWPKESRYVTVHRDSNTWSYQSSVNPDEPESLYAGNASTNSLEIVSVSPRLGRQECDFCSEENASDLGSSKGSIAGGRRAQIWQSGMARVLVTDEGGRRVGILPSGQLVNEIPGAELRKLKFSGNDLFQPVIFVPIPSEASRLNVTVESSSDDATENQAETTIIAPGFAAALSIPDLDSGQWQSMDLSLKQGQDGYNLTLSSNRMYKPVISVDSNLKSVTIDGASIEPGRHLDINLNPNGDSFSMKSTGRGNPGTVRLEVTSIDPESGKQSNFVSPNIPLQQNDRLSLNFPGSGGAISTPSLNVVHKDGSMAKFDLRASGIQNESLVNLSNYTFPEMPGDDDFGDFSGYDSFGGDFGSTGPSGFPNMRLP
ncbi:MAG: hypothetical protein HPY61_08940 [Methanotrichaceae archaeon]|nr:hypothetical protein [Methanotrichaceae archaeon]